MRTGASKSGDCAIVDGNQQLPITTPVNERNCTYRLQTFKCDRDARLCPLFLVVIVIRMIVLLALIRVRMSPVPVFGLLSAACVLKVAIIFVVFG